MNYEIPETMKAWVLGILEYLRWKRNRFRSLKSQRYL